MNTKQKTGIAMMAIVFGLILSPAIAPSEANAIKNNAALDETEYTFSMRGALTAPEGDKPFGSDHVVGHYFIRANDHQVNIEAEFESTSSPNLVLEGWLVDVDTGFKLSTGLFTDETNANRLNVTQEIENPWIYDVFVVTEEPIVDDDPNPHKPVGGAALSKSFGQ